MKDSRALDREQRVVGISAGSIAAMAISFFFVMWWLQVGDERQTSSLVATEAIQAANCTIEESQCALRPTTTAEGKTPVTLREFRARMKLATTTYLSMTLSIIVIIYSILVVRRSRWSWPWLAGGTVLITLYLLSAPPIFDADKQIFPAYERLVTSVNEYRSCDCDVPGDSANIPWTGKLSSNRVGNALLVLAVIALSITIWHQILALRSIASRGPHDEDSQGKASNELRAAKSRFEFHLYFVSAMLVSSVIAVHSYYSWPASILVGDTANALSNLATTIAVVFGAGFTLLIMVVFGPAYFAITQKVRELAESAVGTPSEDESLQSAIETWKKKHDFTMKAHQRVLGILATAGPALVGPTMELLRVVSA